MLISTAVPVVLFTIFASGIVLAVPLGRLFRINLSDNRYTHIDGMRAIAATMVVCCHYIMNVGVLLGEHIHPHCPEAMGAVGVQIFFGITGFLFTRKGLSGSVNVSELIASRVRRIVPLYMVTVTAALAFGAYLLSAIPDATAPTMREIFHAYTYGFFPNAGVPKIGGMSLAGQMGQMWTLAWEWQFYLIVPFVAAILARPTWLAGAALVAGLSMWISYNGAYQPWVFFVPGIVCAIVADRIKLNSIQQIALTIVGIAAFCASVLIDAPLYGMVQMALCAIGFPALLFGHRALFSLKPLRLLGEVSYSIYMLHLLVGGVALTYIQSNWALYPTPAAKLAVASVALAGMFVLSFVSYAFIERPFMGASTKRQSGLDADPGIPLPDVEDQARIA